MLFLSAFCHAPFEPYCVPTLLSSPTSHHTYTYLIYPCTILPNLTICTITYYSYLFHSTPSCSTECHPALSHPILFHFISLYFILSYASLLHPSLAFLSSAIPFCSISTHLILCLFYFFLFPPGEIVVDITGDGTFRSVGGAVLLGGDGLYVQKHVRILALLFVSGAVYYQSRIKCPLFISCPKSNSNVCVELSKTDPTPY